MTRIVPDRRAARRGWISFLQRGGARVIENGRYHLDLRHPALILAASSPASPAAP
ncbi:hypothetical protein [Actinoplanes sp. NPDC051851]|uniref:hypothetical protein n=1 Tax=Actinoplanes sp. NPDC051851 TaxID=3154753 RepID=UPI003421CA11